MKAIMMFVCYICPNAAVRTMYVSFENKIAVLWFMTLDRKPSMLFGGTVVPSDTTV